MSVLDPPDPCTDARTVSQWERQRRQSVRRKKSQWTIICVACGFFTSCLLLVAGMLSITSEYQVTQIFLSFGSYNFYIFNLIIMCRTRPSPGCWICRHKVKMIGFLYKQYTVGWCWWHSPALQDPAWRLLIHICANLQTQIRPNTNSIDYLRRIDYFLGILYSFNSYLCIFYCKFCSSEL